MATDTLPSDSVVLESREGGFKGYDEENLDTPKPAGLGNSSENGQYSVQTPARPTGESRRHEEEAGIEGETQVAVAETTTLATRRPTTDGIRTFGGKYLPFAAGFEHLGEVAPVYRSPRLHTINPTAAVTDDVSYYYTLDSGRTTTASLAANPNAPRNEHVRNTALSARGGLIGALLKPIE